MSSQLRMLLGTITILLLLLVGIGWWTFQVVQVPAIVGKPPTSSTQSPLASPVIDALKQRTINGAIPVADPGSSHRTDPFSK